MTSLAHTPHPAEPMAVGSYRDATGTLQLLPYSQGEYERAIQAYQHRLGTCHFRTGEQVLVVSTFDESFQFGSLGRALQGFGLVLVSCDASYFDAARSESCLRRFDISAVAGINAAVLDGLIALGHDPLKLLSGPVVWARPDAYERLAGEPGIRLRRWLDLGPAVAMECSHGLGAHIDRKEWQVTAEDGEIVLSSRFARAMDFANYRTGVRATLDHSACACGSADPRVVL